MDSKVHNDVNWQLTRDWRTCALLFFFLPRLKSDSFRTHNRDDSARPIYPAQVCSGKVAFISIPQVSLVQMHLVLHMGIIPLSGPTTFISIPSTPSISSPRITLLQYRTDPSIQSEASSPARHGPSRCSSRQAVKARSSQEAPRSNSQEIQQGMSTLPGPQSSL